jgi:hypothetical protein
MDDRNYHSDSRFWTGLFLIGGGALYLAYKLGFPVPEWVFTWEFLLIALGAFTGLKHNFRNAGWIILMGIGSFFLLQREIPQFGMKEYIWPVLIIAVGVLFLLNPRRSSRCRRDRWGERWSKQYNWNDSNIPEPEVFVNGEDTLVINSVFSGVKKTILSKNFKGGKIACVFGGAELDFMQADIQGVAILRLEEVFGGIKLTVPHSWTIQNEIDGVFHGVDDKRSFYSQAPTDANKVLVLKGSAVFAGIEIRSY